MTALATALTLAGPAAADPLTLAACERTTHPSHGGERAHRDLGAGKVAWVGWWSQEGTYSDLHVADCASGQMLRARMAEERISARAPFDRRPLVAEVFERHTKASPAFFRLDRLAGDLKNIAEDIEITSLETDPCACAAAYPDHQGDRAAFGGLE